MAKQVTRNSAKACLYSQGPHCPRVPAASISKEHSAEFNSVNQVKFPVMAFVALVSLLGWFYL